MEIKCVIIENIRSLEGDGELSLINYCKLVKFKNGRFYWKSTHTELGYAVITNNFIVLTCGVHTKRFSSFFTFKPEHLGVNDEMSTER